MKTYEADILHVFADMEKAAEELTELVKLRQTLYPGGDGVTYEEREAARRVISELTWVFNPRAIE